MDEAARRVRSVDLARLAALRARREQEAFREARLRAVARRTAEAARERAEADVARQDAARIAGERAIYDGLTTGGAVGITALEQRRMMLDALGQAVEAAQGTEIERAEAAARAQEAYETALAAYAGRARETRKWDRAQERILTFRRALTERMAESESDDETLMRIGAAQVRR